MSLNIRVDTPEIPALKSAVLIAPPTDAIYTLNSTTTVADLDFLDKFF